MVVTNGNFRPVWRAQAYLDPRVAAIDVHFRIRRIEKDVIVRKEPAVAIVPTPKLGVASFDVAEVRFRQLHRKIVVVEIPERMTINRKYAVFVECSLEMQILDASVNLIARQPVFLFELCAIAL